ncbi:Hemerythrin HHE cation binding domain-containing protein [Albimonas donghaensis]|uniref:Hemerythrin HHE cation binding domain-containing protein n=1 Tax=Albimonas donghaensis TaxID=356660 RepID=A0A1H3AVK9_9RHOB|nr:hemerythrin domain-containing protein [Albimonas donghaensis]SDX32869.1 Hemerythrin HHE cation binding domain-containing protein [Albimonas donghaensis]
MTDIYKTIEEDHGKHRGLLGAIGETSGDSAERRRLWTQFYYEVKSHAAAEEETFYSKLMERPEGQDDARHSVAEHKEMDDLMEELNGMDMSSPAWLAKFKQLRHDYEHHMEEEEEDIFAQARAVFDDQQAERFAKDFGARKEAERMLVDEKAADSLEE